MRPRTRAALMAENALRRQQLIVLQRQVRCPLVTPRDRVPLVLLARLVHGWRNALHSRVQSGVGSTLTITVALHAIPNPDGRRVLQQLIAAS